VCKLARFQNVWVNLEITSAMLNHAPGQFHDAMFNLMRVGQEHALRRIMLGWLHAIHHGPRSSAFVREFRFDDEHRRARVQDRPRAASCRLVDRRPGNRTVDPIGEGSELERLFMSGREG